MFPTLTNNCTLGAIFCENVLLKEVTTRSSLVGKAAASTHLEHNPLSPICTADHIKNGMMP